MKNGNIFYGYNISLKILYILLTLYIASIAIFAKLDNVAIGNMIFLVLISYLIVHEIVFQTKTYYFNKELNLYFMLLIFAAISTFWSIDPDSTIEMSKRMFMIFASLLIIYNILKKYNFSSALFYALFLAVFTNFFIFIGIISVSYETYFPLTDRFIGTTENPNITASIMFLSIFATVIFLMKEKNRYLIILGYLNVIVSYYMILMTISRTALVVSLGLIFVLIIKTLWDPKSRGYFLWSSLLVLILAIFFIDINTFIKQINFALERIGFIFASLSGEGAEHSANERVDLIVGALHTFMNNPIFGTGMDTVKYYMGVYAHNTYAELLANSGLVGTTLYYLIHISLAYKAMLVKNIWIKSYLIMFILSLLAYDMGGVSYYDKLTLTMIVFASYIAEINSKQTDH